MQVITMSNGLYLSGKIKDVRRYLRQAGQTYLTVQAFTEQKLH